MVREHSVGQICGNGVAALNTAEIVLPEWSGMTFNPILALLGFFASFAMTGLIVAARIAGSRKVSSNQYSSR